MDQLTLAAYDADPRKYSRDWLEQPDPEEIHASVRGYFRPGGATADIGSGCGREVDWLNRHGWPSTGYEPSAGLRAEAMRLFPAYNFVDQSLPALAGIPAGHFDNVLCETVLMHLPAGEQLPAIDNLLRILRPGGVLRLSWRAGKDGNTRDAAGRLYEPVDGDAVKTRMEENGAILLDQGARSGASGALIHYVLANKGI
jgi:SAM-dependent methyltransferase